MASPKEFAKTLAVCQDNLIVFIATIIGALATDLLIGVAIGIVVELLIHISCGLKWRNTSSMAYHVWHSDEQTYHIAVGGVFQCHQLVKSAYRYS